MYKVTLTKRIFQKEKPQLMNTLTREITLPFIPFVSCSLLTKGTEGKDYFSDDIESVSYIEEFSNFLCIMNEGFYETSDQYNQEKSLRGKAGWVLLKSDVEINPGSVIDTKIEGSVA